MGQGVAQCFAFDSENEQTHLYIVVGSLTQKANSTRFSCKPGTTKWSSPEVLKCIKSRDYYLEDPFKADVYSFGLIVYEVLTGLVIFDKAQTVEKMKEHIMANNFSQYFTSFDDEKKNYPEFFISFMKRCWAFTPTESPSFHEIIEKIKEARSSLITRSSKTHGRNGRFTRMKKFMKKVTNCRGMATKVSRIFVRPFLRPCPRPCSHVYGNGS